MYDSKKDLQYMAHQTYQSKDTDVYTQVCNRRYGGCFSDIVFLIINGKKKIISIKDD